MQARRVIGYLRVGPREARTARPGRREQRRIITAECARRGLELVGFEEDVRSGRSLRRPGLHAALDRCSDGSADGIVVARLDRLTYSVEDLSWLMHRAVEGRFTFVALDLGLDLATDTGAEVARILASTAHWHPRGVGRRARHAYEHPLDPVGPGRPTSTPTDVADRIRALRADGLTLQAICDELNADGVPTPRGGTHWRPTSLRAIVPPTRARSTRRRTP